MMALRRCVERTRVGLAVVVLAMALSTCSSSPQPKPLAAPWRYLHVPKTGTGWIAVLRNIIDECEFKDVTCPGLHGGGFVEQLQDLKAQDAKKQWYSHRITCKDQLIACNQKDYHRPWTPATDRDVNVVTLLRHPIRRIISNHFWRLQPKYVEVHSASKNWGRGIDVTLAGFNNMHLAMVSGQSWERGYKLKGLSPPQDMQKQLDTARNRLFNPSSPDGVLWFGISDHWNASLCLFHHDFGGQISPSEVKNTRKNQYNVSALTDEDMSMIRSQERWDMALYTDAHFEFTRRAKAAGCWTEWDDKEAAILARLTRSGRP